MSTTRHRTLTIETVPGTNLGETFTGSLAERQIIPKTGDSYLDSLIISFKGDLAATTTVALETFLDLVNPLAFTRGNMQIQLRGRDLFALSSFFYGVTPDFLVGAAGQDDKVHGIRIPVWAPVDPTKVLSYSITRVAVTNISGEVLHLASRWFSEAPAGRTPIYAVQITDTLPATTGISTRIQRLPKLGNLLALIVFNTTVPTVTADTASVQRLFMDAPGGERSEHHIADMLGTWKEFHDRGTADVIPGVLGPYGVIDFRDSPLDLIANDVKVDVETGVASDAVRYIPVIQLPS